MSENKPHRSHDWHGVDEEDSLNQFCHFCEICTCHSPEKSAEPCDRLDEMLRVAAEKALTDAAEDYEGCLVEPELPIGDQPSPMARQYKSAAERLRKRAAAYRREETE